MAARATDGIELTSFSSPINLLKLPENVDQRDIEYLEIVTATAGAAITGKTKGSGSVARTYHVAAGDRLDFALRTIDSVTNVSVVRVVWADF
jgi:hypothetical protein